MNKYSFFLVVCLIGVTSSFGQSSISVDDFTTRNTFAEKTVSGINWMNDGKYYSALTDNKVVKYDITTGQPVQTLVDGGALPARIVIDDYSLSTDEQKI